MEELKKCPFCGGEAILIKTNGYDYRALGNIFDNPELLEAE